MGRVCERNGPAMPQYPNGGNVCVRRFDRLATGLGGVPGPCVWSFRTQSAVAASGAQPDRQW